MPTHSNKPNLKRTYKYIRFCKQCRTSFISHNPNQEYCEKTCTPPITTINKTPQMGTEIAVIDPKEEHKTTINLEKMTHGLFDMGNKYHDEDTLFELSVQQGISQGYVKYTSKEHTTYKIGLKHPVTGLMWIHFIDRLLDNQNIQNPVDLVEKGYNVLDYYLHNSKNSYNTMEYYKWLAASLGAEICYPELMLSKEKLNTHNIWDITEKITNQIFPKEYIIYAEIKACVYINARKFI